MSHFSPAELVDAADGTLAASRAAHLDGCAPCAARVTDLRALQAAARDADVQEPSPLYWQHLSARVHERVARETIVPAWRAAWRDYVSVSALVPLASALAVVALVVASGLVGRRTPALSSTGGAVLLGTPAAEMGIEPDDSDVWQVLTSAAADVPIEDAHAAGMAVGNGAVDRAVQRMTPGELSELRRLLQSELRRPTD